MLIVSLQMQSTICEHRDDGRAGGVFTSYEIVKVGDIQMSTFVCELRCWCCVECVCVCVCVCVCYSSVHYGLHVMVSFIPRLRRS